MLNHPGHDAALSGLWDVAQTLGGPATARAGAKPDDGPVAMGDLASLTTRMVGGDENAYRQFHALYFPRLRRYLLVISGGREEIAKEALQGAFLRVVRHIRRFADEEVFWSWLTVLARSAFVDEERRHRRYRSLLDRFLRRIEPNVAGAGDDADADLFQLLEQNLATLSADDRSLVARKYFTGDLVKTIAASTGVSEKSIESRLVRIRRHLRRNILARLNHEAR